MVVTEIFIIMALIMANGVFAGAEIAVVSLRATRIHALAEAKRVGSQALATLRGTPERFLATVQVGITVVGATAAAFGGRSLAPDLTPAIARMPYVGAYAEQIALGLVVAMVSYLSLVVGELVPKSLALRHGETYALLIAKPLLALSWFARPLVWLLTASSNLVLRPFSDRTTFTEARFSKEELQQIVGEATRSGALDEHTSEIASRAIDFGKLTAAEVMVPRNLIVALPLSATHEQIKQCLLEERRSRILVYEGALDNVVGYVTAKDLLPLAWEGRLIVLKDVLRLLKIFAESTPAVDILDFMRQEHQRLSMIVDEHGALAGLVTFEDVVEELVGDVLSEHEKRLDNIVSEPGGTLLIRGDLPVRDVNRELEIPLQAPDTASTMAGLCIQLAGGAIPQRGARLAANGGYVLVVVSATPRSVRQVRLIPPPLPSVSAGALEPRPEPPAS